MLAGILSNRRSAPLWLPATRFVQNKQMPYTTYRLYRYYIYIYFSLFTSWIILAINMLVHVPKPQSRCNQGYYATMQVNLK